MHNKSIIALAVATAFLMPAAAQYERVSKWEMIKNAAAIVGLIKGVADLVEYGWNKINPPAPPVNPNSQWLCDPSVCSFAVQPGTIIPTDVYQQAMNFIATLGKTFALGEVITICNGWVCIDFTYTGDGFAPSVARKDPRQGYANRPRSAAGGEGSAGSTYTPSSTIWHPNVVYNPGGHLRTGTVTIIWGGGGGGGGPAIRPHGSYETE